MKHFYWISTKEMTCGVSTDDDKIIDSPPILKKFVGGDIGKLRNWMKKQEGYKEIEIEERKQMKAIWKYPINPRQNKIEMPIGAQILSIQTQRGEPQMWALVDPSKQKETRIFQVYGTGWDMPDFSGKYIGSFQVGKETLIFHVFELSDQA